MKISVVIGLAICSWTIIKFLGKLRESLAKVLEREQKDDEMEVETTPKGYNLCVSLHKRFWAWLQTICFMQGEVNTDDKMEKEDSQPWLNTKTSSDLLVVTTSKLSQHVKFRSGEWAEDNWVCGAIQSYQAATWHEQTMSYYFEIKIKDHLNTRVSIGISNENFKNDITPGWDSNTYGYDSDGFVVTITKDLTYTMGDTVGAGVNYVTGEIFSNKNQKLICLRSCNLKTTLYPTFRFNYRSQSLRIESKSTVQVNFKESYVFDVSHHMQHSNLKTSKKWPLQTKLPFQPFFQ